MRVFGQCALRACVVGATLALSGCGGGLDREAGPAVAKAQPAFTGNGVWWNPAEPGSGIFFEAQGGVATFALYAFETNGRPVWYSAIGSFVPNGTGHEFSGTLQRYKGGQSLQSSTPKAPVATVMGEVYVVFRGDSAQVSVPGRSFDARKFFATGQGRPANGAQPETGIYWNPAENGRGYTIEMNDGIAVMGIFHYDAAGEPTWNLTRVDMERHVNLAYLETYRNGQTLSGPWRAATGPVAAGTSGLRFMDACSGSFWFSTMAETPIRRSSFGSLPAAEECAASRGAAARSAQDGAARGDARVIPLTSWNAYKSLSVDGGGNVYALEENLVRRITPGGSIELLAGSRTPGTADGAGEGAGFSSATGLATDGAGNVYVAEGAPPRIRKITPAGVVSTFTGGRIHNGLGSPDGSRDTAALGNMTHIKSDAAGNLYVTQSLNIRKVAPDGSISTVVGNTGLPPVTEGQMQKLWDITALAVDPAGNLYVAENESLVTARLRKFDKMGRPILYPGTATGALPICAVTDMAADASNVYLSCKYALTGFSWQTVLKVTSKGWPSIYAGDIPWVVGVPPGPGFGPTGSGAVIHPGPIAMDPRDMARPRLIIGDRVTGLVEVLPGAVPSR